MKQITLTLTTSEASHLFDWLDAGLATGSFSHEDSNGPDDVDSYTAACGLRDKLAPLTLDTPATTGKSIDHALKAEIVEVLVRMYSSTTENVTRDVNEAGIDTFLDNLDSLGY